MAGPTTLMAQRSGVALLPAALGLLGWLGAGPLVATLLVGRTAVFLPSLRWLGAAALTYALLVAITLLAAPRGSGPEDVWRQRRHWLATGLGALAPVASVIPLLSVLYADDVSYHLTVAEQHNPALFLALYVFVLAIAGSFIRWWATHRAETIPAAGGPRLASMPGGSPSGAAAWFGAAAVGGMTVANFGLFGPLSSATPLRAMSTLLLVANLALLAGAAALAVLAARGAAPVGALLLAAWVASTPVGDALPHTLIGATLLIACFGLLDVERGPRAPIRWLGVALVAVALVLAHLLAPPAGETRPFFWSSPQEQNASLGAVFSRLYAGAGALTTAGSPPAAPAEALTAGAWLCFGLLLLWLLWTSRPLAGPRAVAATCLALVAMLALWPVTPAAALSLAGVALVPLASPLLWRAPGRASLPLALGVAGYAFAGTSPAMLGRAATELVNRWPALISLPAFGLVLLAVALALLVASSAGDSTPTAARRPLAPTGAPVRRCA